MDLGIGSGNDCRHCDMLQQVVSIIFYSCGSAEANVNPMQSSTVAILQEMSANAANQPAIPVMASKL